MRAKIFLDTFHLLFFRNILGWFVGQLGIGVVVELEVEGAVVFFRYLCDGLVQDNIGFVVNAHYYSFKYTIVFSCYFGFSTDVFLFY